MFDAVVAALAVVGAVAVVGVVWLILASGRPSWCRRCRRHGHCDLRGRAVVITGAGNGLGRLLALELSAPRRAVAALVLLDVDDNALETTSRAVKERGSHIRVVTLCCDVSNWSAVEEACAVAAERLAPVHLSVLINNAAVLAGQGATCATMDPCLFARTMDVNVKGPFHMLRALLPEIMARNDGLVVNVSSVIGMMGGAQLADYSGSKWALCGLHESLRLEMLQAKASGVRTLLVCPFAMDTSLFPGIFASQPWVVRACFPTLKASAVAKRVVDAMESGETFVVVPDLLRYASLVSRMLPTQLHDALLEACGGTTGMLSFIPRDRRQIDDGKSTTAS